MCPRQGMAESQTLIKVITGVLQVPQNTAERAHRSCFGCTSSSPRVCCSVLLLLVQGCSWANLGSLPRGHMATVGEDTRTGTSHPLLWGQYNPQHQHPFCGQAGTSSSCLGHSQTTPASQNHPRLPKLPLVLQPGPARSSVSVAGDPRALRAAGVTSLSPHRYGSPRQITAFLHVPPVGFCHT